MEIALIIWLLFGMASAIIMSNNGRSGCAGFALGVLLGPFGVLIALVMGKDHRALEKQALAYGAARKCPYCAELIKAEATKCRFCGSDVPPLSPT